MLNKIEWKKWEGKKDSLECPIEENKNSSYIEIVFGECFPDRIVFEIMTE